jgi:hypothetical protein
METFKKRQKASARKEKQERKAARRLDRKNEKAKGENRPGEEFSSVEEPVSDLPA